MSSKDPKQQTRPGTPIFDEAGQTGRQAAGGEGKSRMDKAGNQPDRPDAGRSRPDARDISKQQGTDRDTPQREHERERDDAKPARVRSKPASKQQRPESVNQGAKGKDDGGQDEDVPLRPPQGHGDESEIDESEQAR